MLGWNAESPACMNSMMSLTLYTDGDNSVTWQLFRSLLISMTYSLRAVSGLQADDVISVRQDDDVMDTCDKENATVAPSNGQKGKNGSKSRLQTSKKNQSTSFMVLQL